jgi:hypothetical protein
MRGVESAEKAPALSAALGATPPAGLGPAAKQRKRGSAGGRTRRRTEDEQWGNPGVCGTVMPPALPTLMQVSQRERRARLALLANGQSSSRDGLDVRTSHRPRGRPAVRSRAHAPREIKAARSSIGNGASGCTTCAVRARMPAAAGLHQHHSLRAWLRVQAMHEKEGKAGRRG